MPYLKGTNDTHVGNCWTVAMTHVSGEDHTAKKIPSGLEAGVRKAIDHRRSKAAELRAEATYLQDEGYPGVADKKRKQADRIDRQASQLKRKIQ